ncbi:MAG TPA: TetR/AcrR family transcriptional regulator [Aeromicrobium sp.]|nr:TetR/AcrR family transcriptional regulator [Aeromicrobium sp.]
MSDVTRTRLSPDDRRRQLLGIGLRMLVDKPIQDLSLDAVASEAGISRSLLFHYFPTKTDYYDAVIGAAVRRVMRNVAPDEGVDTEAALRHFIERFYAQIERRRTFYLALVFGNGTISLGSEGVDSLRMTAARRIIDALGQDDAALPAVHGWVAYVEDRALQWSGRPKSERAPLDAEVERCARAFHVLVEIEGS